MHSRGALFESQASLFSDRERLDSFERAILRAVKPGDVVVNLGAGIGLLSLLACRAGARKVFAIEPDDAGELAKSVLAANGVVDRVELVRNPSWHTRLPESADVVMGDLFRAGLNGTRIRQFIDARKRMLKPGGVLLPHRLRVVVAPVEAPEEYGARVGMWRSLYGFDYSSVRKVAAGRMAPAKLAPHHLSVRPETMLAIDLAEASNAAWQGRANFEFARPATVHGLALWLRTELDAGEEISDEPADAPTSRRQQFVPFDEALLVGASEAMDVAVSIGTEGDAWDWTVITRSSDGRETSRQVYTASRDAELGRIPEARSSALLGARRRVLESLQAQPTSARELTDQLLASHGALFPTRRAAEELVADLLGRFAQTLPSGT